jgi:uncharacterized protein YfcZ (UPF0381/DUF406 family)
MARINDPYSLDIGPRDDLTEARRYCECCGLAFTYMTAVGNEHIEKSCRECGTHVKDGTPEQQVEMHRTHEPRLQAWIVKVHDRANELESERNQVRAEIADMRDRVASALKTRNRFRNVATAMLDEHEPSEKRGGCRCGEGKYPCLTVRAAIDADRGIVYHLERGKGARAVQEYITREKIKAAFADDDYLDELG